MSAEAIQFIVLVPAAYVLGSIPMGIIIARLIGGVDPRSTGSGNIGATNVSRSAGKAAGVLTLVADAAKGAVPTIVACKVSGGGVALVSATGLAAFIGHLFPVFLGFRGGKGVATALGVMIVVSPVATLLSAAAFAAVFIAGRFVSLGSIVAAALLPVFMSLVPASRPFIPMGVVVAALVIIKHKENIKRLASGSENRL